MKKFLSSSARCEKRLIVLKLFVHKLSWEQMLLRETISALSLSLSLPSRIYDDIYGFELYYVFSLAINWMFIFSAFTSSRLMSEGLNGKYWRNIRLKDWSRQIKRLSHRCLIWLFMRITENCHESRHMEKGGKSFHWFYVRKKSDGWSR